MKRLWGVEKRGKARDRREQSKWTLKERGRVDID